MCIRDRYGAGGWDGGIWSGEVETTSKNPMWKEFLWPSGDQMRHLKTFILSEGQRYQYLVPCTERILPNQSAGPKGTTGWAYGAATKEQAVSYTHLRAHETVLALVCRLLLEKKNN